MNAPAGGHSLGDPLDLAQRLLQGKPSPNQFAHLAVASKPTAAGGNQVAQARQAGEGVGVGPQGGSQAGDLNQPPAQQCRLGVVAVFQSIADPRSNRHHILQRPAQFHTHQVAIGVDAEAVGRKPALHQSQQLGLLPGDHDAAGETPGELLGMAGTTQRGGGAGPPHLLQDLAGTQQCLVLDPLDHADHGGLGSQQRGEGLQCASQKTGRNGGDHQFGPTECLGGLGRQFDRVGEREARQIAAVFAGGGQLGVAGRRMRPEHHVVLWLLGEHQGHGGPHAPASQDGNFGHGGLTATDAGRGTRSTRGRPRGRGDLGGGRRASRGAGGRPVRRKQRSIRRPGLGR